VHEQFSTQAILKLKAEHPGDKVLVHPECKRPVVLLADKVGSTAVLLKYAVEDDCNDFIIATESGILHEMQKQAPHKNFIPVPPEVSEGSVGCSCNECAYMRLNTLEKLYQCLLNETPEIEVDKTIIERAKLPIDRMLELSK
jgi:quinolinate synthase